MRSSAPRSQDRTPASATPRDPSLAANYRGSGLVHRRVSPVAPRPEGPVIELWPGERVHMPPPRPTRNARLHRVQPSLDLSAPILGTSNSKADGRVKQS